MFKFFFETYGCQMNTAESAALILAARERNWEKAENASHADIVLLNTCSVRATAEQRVRGRLAHYAAEKKKRPFTLFLAGCMAERLGKNFQKDFPALDHVIGTKSRHNFPMMLKAIEDGKTYSETDEIGEFSFSSVHFDEKNGNKFRSFIPIMHGCNNYCSYCIVPYVRGREISRSPESILNEIRLVTEKGVREVTLLGQNVNSYLWKTGELDFPGLLELVSKNLIPPSGISDENRGVRWLRFLSSHPKDFSLRAISTIAENPCFCRHIHLCVQHGSDKILSAMNRRYNRIQYLELVKNLRSAMPDLSLSTDILVGFPGETEADFEEILTLMEEVKFLYAYTYHFNPREGTEAYSLPERVDEDTKRERLSRVIALQKKHTAEILKNRVGREAVVLAEGISKKNADELIGRTERDEMVVFPGDSKMVGSFGKLTLSSIRGNTFRAEYFESIER